MLRFALRSIECLSVRVFVHIRFFFLVILNTKYAGFFFCEKEDNTNVAFYTSVLLLVFVINFCKRISGQF